MATPQTVTITSASNTTYSSYTKVVMQPGKPGAPTSSHEAASQVLRVGAAVDTSGGTAASLRFVLKDSATVYKVVDKVLTVTAARDSATDPAAGYYVMTVSASSGDTVNPSDFVDLTGYDLEGGKEWYFGLAGAFGGSAAALKVHLWPTRAI
jgi:hypothetical protein